MRLNLIICAMIGVLVAPGVMAQKTEIDNGDVKIEQSSTSSTPQLHIRQISTGDTSMEFDFPSAPTRNFSLGISGSDTNFKLTNTSNLTGAVVSAQSDTVTMMQVWQPGIVDFNNQSRTRAFLTHIQVVPSSIWTPIEFDDDSTGSGGYDEHGEFTVWTPTPTPAFFTATVDGLYQINARTEYEYGDPAQLNPNGFVSIAIFLNGVIHSQGNNLQMITPAGNVLWYNNAPNVSDVVALQAGDIVDIRAWQSLEAGPGVVWLFTGTEKTFVSIHKVS